MRQTQDPSWPIDSQMAQVSCGDTLLYGQPAILACMMYAQCVRGMLLLYVAYYKTWGKYRHGLVLVAETHTHTHKLLGTFFFCL